jgi:hypothetical protein
VPPAAGTLSAELQQALTLVLTNQAKLGQPKRISEKLPGIEDSLSRIFATDDESLWPPFWHRFANAPKNTRATLLANMLRTRVNSDDGNGCFPAVSPAMVEAVTSAKFCTDDHTELEHGFNIFTMITTIQGIQAVAQQTFLYTASVNGQTAPSTTELRDLSRTKAQFPRTCTQASSQLRSYVTASQELFGMNHPFTVHTAVFVQKLEKLLPKFETYWLDRQGGVAAGLTRLIYFMHMLVNQYFHDLSLVEIGDGAPLPHYQEALNVIQRDHYHLLPELPLHMLAPPAQPSGTPAAGQGQGGGRSPAKLNATQSRSGDGSRRQPAAEGQLANNFVKLGNSQPHEALVARFEASGKPFKDLMGEHGHTKPFVDGHMTKRENQVCLSYHLRKFCRDDCHRQGSHRPLTTTEQSKVAQFLTDLGIE